MQYFAVTIASELQVSAGIHVTPPYAQSEFFAAVAAVLIAPFFPRTPNQTPKKISVQALVEVFAHESEISQHVGILQIVHVIKQSDVGVSQSKGSNLKPRHFRQLRKLRRGWCRVAAFF